MFNRQILTAVIMCGLMLMGGAAAAQTVRIGLAEDPDTLDPTLNRTFVSVAVSFALCDRLFGIGLELEIVPQLATEWKWTEDRMGLVIRLRRGVKFHDGEPFDAAAVKYQHRTPFDDAGIDSQTWHQCDYQCRDHR